MKSKQIPMSIEEFELIPHPFGWKVEYWDGQAHLSPRDHHVYTKLTLGYREIRESCQIISVDSLSKEQMIAAFFEAFHDSVEFCNWSMESIKDHATKNINGYFQGVRGNPLTASVMALEPSSNRLLGLALFVEKEANVMLDLLFVKPSRQRTGIATQLVTNAANLLYKQGIKELHSAYHICNEHSCNWHHQYGFAEILEPFYCRLKYSWYRQEVWRQEKLGALENLAELQRVRDYWYGLLGDDWKY
jgi:GNAT superfamily N-acetyltransferase